MKKALVITFGVILFVLIMITLAGWYYLNGFKPNYEEEISLAGLQAQVNIHYDNFGIPHVYASSELDAHFALGYIHAKDRLWQMELLKRIGAGRLSEVLGPDLVETDKFFRAIGIPATAKKSLQHFEKYATDHVKMVSQAYVDGINAYKNTGQEPIEYKLVGMPNEPYSIKDAILTNCYMAFGFNQAFTTDPLVTRIAQNFGAKHLSDLNLNWDPNDQMIPTTNHLVEDVNGPQKDFLSLMESVPVPPWIGSNSWVLSPQKSATGEVILANDTHIGYAAPSVWYEAHIEYPGYRQYGHYLAGIPFAVISQNDSIATGLTMFENDDTDFYIEKVNPDNPHQVWYKDGWEDLEVSREQIKIKGMQEPVEIEIKKSRHGYIINDVISDIAKTTDQPVAMWWVLNQFPFDITGTYDISKSQNLEEVKTAVAKGTAPGLNVMYGDKAGNIAWLAMAKLPIRPSHVNSKVFLDGASGKDDIIGWYDFEDNPQSINPEAGFVYSANNQPDTTSNRLVPGYYVPEDRAKRIVQFLDNSQKWTIDQMKEMMMDGTSANYPKFAKLIVEELNSTPMSELDNKVLSILSEWKGDSDLNNVGVTIFTKLISKVAELVYKDELGDEDFLLFQKTFLFPRSHWTTLNNPNSIWWDNVNTDERETRNQILKKALSMTTKELQSQLGDDMNKWTWGQVHTVTHPHLIGQQGGILAKFFNVGPFPMKGNEGAINNQKFMFDGDGNHEVLAGPAKRRIVDFSNIAENTWSILPTGNSGNPMSPHYNDQAEMFVEGKFRKQMMDKTEIQKKTMHITRLLPK